MFVLLLEFHAAGLVPNRSLKQSVLTTWSSKDGLPQNTILSILQTQNGYLWFGTEDGLARFNGTEFTTFWKTKMGHFAIHFLLEDKRQDVLWIASWGGGLTAYHQGKFVSYTIQDGLPSNYVSSLARDAKGNLWIGTKEGLALYDGKKIQAYKPENPLIARGIRFLAISPDGFLWGATSAGIFALEPDTGTVRETIADRPDAESLYFDQQGTLWIGTRANGLYSFLNGKLTRVTQPSLKSDRISAVYQDREGSLWVAVYGRGLCRMNNGVSECFEQKNGLASNMVMSVYEDREGSLWAGTFDGVTRIKDRRFIFYDRSTGLKNEVIYALALARDGSVWAGTGDGFSHLQNGHIKNYETGQTYPSNNVISIAEGSRDTLWVGTARGLREFRNGQFVGILGADQGLVDRVIRSLYQDRKGNLWIGADGKGLIRFKDGQFEFFTKRDGLNGDQIYSIFEDHEGNLWLATEGNVSQFKNGIFTRYPMAKDANGNQTDAVCIYEDSDHDLWIGTSSSGLARLRNGKIRSYGVDQGLFDGKIWTIVEDNNGSLWMTSDYGLYRVRKSDLNDLDRGKIKTIPYVSYGTKEGLPSSEFNGSYQATGLKDARGKMLFASVQGIVEVDADSFAMNKLAPPVVLEGAVLDGQPIPENAAVPAGNGNLEFHFAALSYVDPENVSYKYMLEGYDKEWTFVGNRQNAYYTNLPPGNYRFRVIAANNDGVWNEQGAHFPLVLKPRFYQTGLFKLLCMIGTMTVVLAGVMIHRVNNRRLVSQVEARTRELREAKDLAESSMRVAESATRAKSEFLANMSHEIRTPLNGILGALELTRQSKLGANEIELLDMASGSATHLLSLVNELLDFSRIEAGKMELLQEPFQLSEALGEVKSILAGRAREKGLELSCQIGPDLPKNVIGDPTRLKQVLLNLIGNAIKFTETGWIKMSAEVENDMGDEVEIKFCVADTGIGVAPEYHQAIFESFTQADNSITRKYGGAGLGLAISTRLVSLMRGRMWLESEVGHGSKFYFTVLLGVSSKGDSLHFVATPEAANVPLPALKILLAEDNLVNQKLAMKLLEKDGHQVTLAQNGKDALSLLEQSAFDLVLMDVQMPEMDGLTAATVIRKQEETSRLHIPIIALTAHATKEDCDRCLRAGMDGYVAKPVSPANLRQTIRYVLNGKLGGTDDVEKHWRG